jgi:hypothetical protein
MMRSIYCAGSVMPTLVQLYEHHAEECIRSAAKADDPKQRDMLLKLASAWREDAERLRRGEARAPTPRNKR